MANRRGANLENVLVYMDEPQLVLLNSYKTKLIAVAIPSKEGQMFFATTMRVRDWESYLDGTVDLRYLFTYPDQRVRYTFDLGKMKNRRIMMDPWDKAAPEEYLPSPRFFSDNHTEELDESEISEDQEKLIIDGEWELQDFGQFQQKYSDIYAFQTAVAGWSNPNVDAANKRRIQGAFLGRPFKGGFSYVHLFRDLNENVPRRDRIHLDKIQYASPGFVEMFGNEETFAQVNNAIVHLLSNRAAAYEKYTTLYGYLSKNRYLQMNGDDYISVPAVDKYINDAAVSLCEALVIPKFETIKELSRNNPLVSAKVVLSFYRRLSEASAYFAQGRVALPG